MSKLIDNTQRELYGFFRKAGRFLYDYTGGKSGQRRVLMFLSKCPQLTQRELQSLMGIKSSSMSEMITKMDKEGLIEKRRSPSDGRVILLSLSEKGEAAAMEGKAQLDLITEDLYSCLSEQERQQLHDLMEKLITHWDTIKNDQKLKLKERGK